MKYIRTEDKIYVKSDAFDSAYYDEWMHCHVFVNLVKGADTIEELCDEFVGIDSQGHYIIHNDKWLDGARIIPLEKVNYYGAIWTDKGLIYVAKMNDKGDLELL